MLPTSTIRKPLDEGTLQNWDEQFERKINGGKLSPSRNFGAFGWLPKSMADMFLIKGDHWTTPSSTGIGINETLRLMNEETILNLEGIQICSPKTQLFNAIWSNSIFSSQCLVMILEMFDPGNWWCRNHLSRERGQISSRNNEARVILAHLLSTTSMVPRALSHVKPNQSIRWQGSHIDFSSFVIKLPHQDRFYCFRYANTHFAIPEFLWPSHRQEK